MNADLIATAQNVARNTGWAVFPCGENKMPCISKKEGGHGCLDATTDPVAIKRMFSHRKAALIGVATGEASGFDVLDADVKHDAARAWLLTAETKIPPTRTYQTRSGGFHLLFLHAPGVHNTESYIARGIDTRGTGGYIILWYAAGFPCTDHSPIAKWPEWLLEALFYKPEPDTAPPRRIRAYVSAGTSAQNMVAASLRKLREAAEGSRHHTLRAPRHALWAAFWMPPDCQKRMLPSNCWRQSSPPAAQRSIGKTPRPRSTGDWKRVSAPPSIRGGADGRCSCRALPDRAAQRGMGGGQSRLSGCAAGQSAVASGAKE
ncbi:MAG TPA: bifunctional DNA primase/polymerase [Acetobacteraceae bacterium]|nr:bifunctional DNA primase/polymerase [Acetobacteraceae bacterium]